MQIFVKNLEDKNIDYDVNEEDNVSKLVDTVSEREKRTKSLVKRIKRLQWKQLESHTTEQLESFYERQAKLLPLSNNCHEAVKCEPNNISQHDKAITSTRFSNCPPLPPPSQTSSQLESQEIQTQTQTTQTTPNVTPSNTLNYLSQAPVPPQSAPLLVSTLTSTTTSSSLTSSIKSTANQISLDSKDSSPIPHKLTPSVNSTTPSSKNGEINLLPTVDIKLIAGSSVINSLSKQPPQLQQNSGLRSSNVSTSNQITTLGSTVKSSIPDKPSTSNKPNVTSEATLSKPKAETKQSKRSNPGRSINNIPPDVNQLVNNFTPSILDCAEDELLRSAVGIITANLKHLEYSYDSDATESSSGGESCDEFENVFSDNFSKPNTSSNILEPIERKANWRWLNERSAIASRWTWLQAQVADLEFKIRQQNEMYRQLRASKGSIAFYCKEAPANNPNLIPNSITKSSSITTTPKTSSSTWTQQSTSLNMKTSPTTSTSRTLPSISSPSTTTTATPLQTKPTIQIPSLTEMSTSPSKPNSEPLRHVSETTTSTTLTTLTTTATAPIVTTTGTITTTATTTSSSLSTTDSLSVDVSSFKFAKNSPSTSSSDNNKKFTDMLGSTNGTLNTQANLSTSSGPNSNGLSDYSLPSVNSDSTISLSPPLETMSSSRAKTPSPSHTPPPTSSHRYPSFESSLQATTTTTPSTSAPPTLQTSSITTFSPSILSTAISATTTTTTTTCTTSSSLAVTPQKPSPSVKESTTPSSEERHDANMLANSEKEIHHCARTLPLKQMRKRKLVRSCNIITNASRKIARYSTVQCSCSNYPKFVSPCVLCNGRFSHLQTVDTDCMPYYERYALLDPSYHPVLSLPTDVALGLYFSKILKKDTTAIQKPFKSGLTGTTIGTSKSSALSSSSSSITAASNKTKSTNKRSAHSEFPYKFGPDSKKNKINRGKSQANISASKLKKKYDGTTKKKYAKGKSGLRKRNLRSKNDQSDDDDQSRSPSLSEHSHVPLHRRRQSEQYAYDINNIVIPYSIASTTRVEKLQYKEIITPKWRCIEVDHNNTNNNSNHPEESKESLIDGVSGGAGAVTGTGGPIQPNVMDTSSEKSKIFKFDHEGEETDEDISDEAFAIRHAKCEINERRQRNLHLLRNRSTKTSKASKTNHHHQRSPSTENISSSSSLTPNSQAQTLQ